jgi:hypothetical protein
MGSPPFKNVFASKIQGTVLAKKIIFRTEYNPRNNNVLVVRMNFLSGLSSFKHINLRVNQKTAHFRLIPPSLCVLVVFDAAFFAVSMSIVASVCRGF